jgi:chromosome segregation ATPase
MLSQDSRPLIPLPAILCLLCLVLGLALLYRHRVAQKSKERTTATITHYSNEWAKVSEKLREQKLVNAAVERNYAAQAEELKGYSNTMAVISAELSSSQAEAKASQEALKKLLSGREARITTLEGERTGLGKNIEELNRSISNLETQIAQTEQKLASSSADRVFLLGELKRLETEKAELEKRFHNLAALREQIRQVRDELSVSRRLEWIRRGFYSKAKGAQLLRNGLASAAPESGKYNLDVEVRQDQEPKVLTPEAH